VKNELTDESLLRLSNHLAQHMGINFSAERFGDLKAKMTALADAFDFDDLDEFTQWLLSDSLNREQIELLADFLTVGETYFFRDPKSFLVLENEILPQLIAARQKSRFMRIWSAACCTGEEPYSIAMLLKKMIADIDNWQISILGTDINPTFLERAEEGIYSDWSFRATPAFFKEKFFKVKKNKFFIDPQIKKLVRFEWLNLAELERLSDPGYSSMDIIFCRNVLIYFSTEHGSQIISALSKCLTPDGYLFVGPNELPAAGDKTFESLHRNGAIILQRTKQSEKPDFASHLSHGITAPNGSTDAFNHAEEKYFELSTNAVNAVSVEPSTENSSSQESDSTRATGARIPSLEEAQDRYDRALYQEAAEMLLLRCQNGGDFSSLVLLAKSFANHSELKNALKWCDQAIKANRLNASTHYLRATILQEQGANNEAMHSLKQALLMDSSFVLAEFNLGILHRQSGNLREAQRHFKSALKLLSSYEDDDILPESEGTTASGMRVIVSSLMSDTRR
jgi:chemotaxis protein methyltransferase CheR